jgi:hypothetical protein
MHLQVFNFVLNKDANTRFTNKAHFYLGYHLASKIENVIHLIKNILFVI